MAEFCKDCAPRYGMQDDLSDVGGLCEGCGKIIPSNNLIDKIKRIIEGLFNRIFKK